uniref:DUF4351 domain-containing protein n=1 Tax=Cyanothece sp. (strain PCC 7425 / ATCC 29141) TaxID=395961 RepID=B8HQ21_CYAP4
MTQPRSDQDSAWKEILRQYFQEAIVFFFPQTAEQVDWSRPYEFLDKEFQQIAPEAETGKRYADQLVKVWLKQGEELWLLIHVEVQAARESEFARRMFVYNLRIFDRFNHPAISLAILCDTSKTWRPESFSFDYPDTTLSFRFGRVKLLDYRDRFAELEQRTNPFAVVVMAHLKAQATRRDDQQRKISKLSLIRRLYEGGYTRQEVINLFRFIDWVMILPEALKQEFWRSLKTYEEERRMPFITSVEEIGFERGQRSLILKLLQRRIGEVPEALQYRIDRLSSTELESLAEALLDFTTFADLENWFTQKNA